MKNPTRGMPSISPSIKVLSTAAWKQLPQWRSIFRTATVFILPESWVNAVTVRRQSDTGEWRFVLYREDLDRSVTELLRIRVTSPSDYQDKFETAEYRDRCHQGGQQL